jgi:hypothetical protein
MVEFSKKRGSATGVEINAKKIAEQDKILVDIGDSTIAREMIQQDIDKKEKGF